MPERLSLILLSKQVTTSDTHPKSFDTFEDAWLRTRLGIEYDDLEASNVEQITVFYALLPKLASQYRAIKEMRRSFAWKPADDADGLHGDVQFGLLIPEELLVEYAGEEETEHFLSPSQSSVRRSA